MERRVPTQDETIQALVERSKRKKGPRLRWTFLREQVGHRKYVPGPLHVFVRNHDDRALDLYLLALLVAAGKPYAVSFDAIVWARALGNPRPSGVNAVSRAWKRLVDMRLIERRREKSKAVITLLQEDGSGTSYTPTSASDRYFSLPLTYWSTGWCTRLSLSAKAMLFVALSRPGTFYLPYHRAVEWYGLSADTARRGLHELEDCGLIHRDVRYKLAPLTVQGWAPDHRYTLRPPFGAASTKPEAVEVAEAAMDTS